MPSSASGTLRCGKKHCWATPATALQLVPGHVDKGYQTTQLADIGRCQRCGTSCTHGARGAPPSAPPICPASSSVAPATQADQSTLPSSPSTRCANTSQRSSSMCRQRICQATCQTLSSRQTLLNMCAYCMRERGGTCSVLVMCRGFQRAPVETCCGRPGCRQDAPSSGSRMSWASSSASSSADREEHCMLERSALSDV